ncbi:unnamed protein product, partial [Anisakis simplex]|uniref:Ig-like domain-containing protein n=1 Tax=Anisakis simplex TaxID=6269 RepID=A0A0M3K4Y0_ANISI
MTDQSNCKKFHIDNIVNLLNYSTFSLGQPLKLVHTDMRVADAIYILQAPVVFDFKNVAVWVLDCSEIAPKIAGPPFQTIDAVLNQTVQMECKASGTPSPDITWSLGGKTIFPSEKTQVSSAFIWCCVFLSIAPQILEGERIVQVKENTTLTLECQASGNPTPKIIWKRDGVVVNSAQGARLVIQSTTASDAGRFTCEATNEAGKAVADFEVDVFIKPRFRDLKSDIRVRNGERTRLECKVDGHPLPAV